MLIQRKFTWFAYSFPHWSIRRLRNSMTCAQMITNRQQYWGNNKNGHKKNYDKSDAQAASCYPSKHRALTRTHSLSCLFLSDAVRTKRKKNDSFHLMQTHAHVWLMKYKLSAEHLHNSYLLVLISCHSIDSIDSIGMAVGMVCCRSVCIWN